MGTFCLLIVIGIVVYAVYAIWSDLDKEKKKNQAIREAREAQFRNQVNEKKNQLEDQRRRFNGALFGFLTNYYGSYQNVYLTLKGIIAQMKEDNQKLVALSKAEDYSETISQCENLAEDFLRFGQKVNCLPETRMMDPANYGSIQKAYWDSVRSMNKGTADAIINECLRSRTERDYAQLFATDLESVLRCVWFYATEKPYSAESFQRAVNVFYCLSEREHVDIIIATFYAMKQMGGEEVLYDRIRKDTMNAILSAEQLTLIASALMWMDAYQAENMILQHMLSTGKQMSAKTQERLHSLTNGGGKAPNGFDVVSTENAIYFDVSALAWKDDEYTGLFENLAFREKTLTYSLAVRDEDKELFLTSGINVPGLSAILDKLKLVLADEYGSGVAAELKKCVAMSGSGEEHMESILVESEECKQMGILVHVARIGKKLNIKFYTLFMPGSNGLAEQKQQVLSLYKKLSPSVAMWESSMKDTVLMAIQQLLNAEPQSTAADSEPAAGAEDGPVF